MTRVLQPQRDIDREKGREGGRQGGRQQIKFVSSQLPFIDVFFAIACSVRDFNYILSLVWRIGF